MIVSKNVLCNTTLRGNMGPLESKYRDDTAASWLVAVQCIRSMAVFVEVKNKTDPGCIKRVLLLFCGSLIDDR